MAEYIEREATINRIERYASGAYGIDLGDAKQFTGDEFADTFCEGLNSAVELIGDIPAADVAPVVHGRWEFSERDVVATCLVKCSACGWAPKSRVIPTLWMRYEGNRHCGACGAKMDGGTDHG